MTTSFIKFRVVDTTGRVGFVVGEFDGYVPAMVAFEKLEHGRIEMVTTHVVSAK